MASGELRQRMLRSRPGVAQHVMGLVLRRQVLRDPSVLQYSQEQPSREHRNDNVQGLVCQ